MMPLTEEREFELAHNTQMRREDRALAQRAFDLVALDLDGTVLGKDGELAPGVRDAVQTALRQGLAVSLVSGRGRLPLLPYLSELGLTTPYVASGGAYIAYPNDGRVIHSVEFVWDDVAALAAIARGVGASLFFESAEWMLFERAPGSEEWTASDRRFKLPVVQDAVRSAPSSPSKISIVGDAHVLALAEYRVQERLPGLTSAYTSPRCVDFYPAGVSKGSGLAHLVEHLGLGLARTAVVGDYYNDLSMFEVAGWSVAMGNAPVDVQAAADVIAPGNDQGGAAWALRQLMRMDSADLPAEGASPTFWSSALAQLQTRPQR